MAEGRSPAIIAVNITKLSKDSVTVNWMTDVKADSTVKFGKTAAYDYVVRTDKGKDKTAHSVILRGLAPGTGYHYRVFSKSAANLESSSADLQFKTSGQPVANSVLPSTPYGWLKLIVIVLAAGSMFLISIVAAVELKHWLNSRPRA
jgi:hypothetical protein